MITHHLKKYFITNFKKFFGALLVFGLLFSSIPAPAFAIIYQPGVTLNPNCLPTDTNCGVDTSQTFATGTAGTDFGITSSGTAHTFNLPSASSTARGLLTAADWTSFNNKISSQWTTSGSNIYYNTGNVGIGTANPGQKLEVAGSVLANGFNATSTSSPFQINGMTVLNVGNGTTFVGDSAGANNQALALNATFVGYHAGQNNTTGIFNTAVGGAALNSNTTGSNNTANGAVALAANTTGGNNSAFGAMTLQSNITGSDNTGVGTYVLVLNTGNSNTAVGSGALLQNTTGGFNTALGNVAGTALTTGSDNTLLGANAGGNLTTGNRNIIIGSGISAPSATSSNQLSIGNLIFGTELNATGTAISTGNVGIGTINPSSKLQVAGTIESTGLLFSEGANTVLGFNYPDTTYDRRLRITAGKTDTADNSQGASVDLHGNGAGGALDLVAGGATGALTFWTNNTQRAVIDASGNVGIGTTTPNNALYVQGAIGLSSTTPATTANALYNQGGSLYWNGSAVGGGSSQWTTSGSNIYYNTGNVAIGTTTPSATARLYIEGSAAALENPGLVSTGGTILGTAIGGTDTVIEYDTSGTFTPPTGVTNVRVLVVGGGAGGDNGVSGEVYAHGGGGGFVTYRSAFAVTPGNSLTVTVGNGGTAATDGYPSSLSTVVANGGVKANNLGAGGRGGDSGNDIDSVVTNYTGGSDSTWGGAGGSGAGGASSVANDTTGSAGGIGYSSNITGAPVAYAGGGGGSGTSGGSAGANGGGAGSSGVGGNGTVNTGGGGGAGTTGGTGGSGVVIVRFATIQGTTPANQALLRVTDTGGFASSTLAFFESAGQQGCIIAGQTGLSCSSDATLKKHINSLGDSLGNVLALKPVAFDWNSEANGGGNHIGFIAQDVEKIYPGLVVLDPNGKKALSYDKFAPIIVKAMQEQYGGMMGINIASISDYTELFSSTTTLDTLASAGAGDNFITDPISYIRERVASGIKIVRNIVTERVVAVSGYFKRIFANELCLTDSTGALVCVTGDQLKNIGGAAQQNQESGIMNQELILTDSLQTISDSASSTEATPAFEPAPTTEPEPAPVIIDPAPTAPAEQPTDEPAVIETTPDPVSEPVVESTPAPTDPAPTTPVEGPPSEVSSAPTPTTISTESISSEVNQ